MNNIIYDYETSGLSPWFDIPLDGAFVLTDENFNKLDELSIKIKLPKGIIPSPMALLVQKAEINKLYEGDSYYEAMSKLYKKSEEWGPACWIGYNNIGFDEKFTRMGLYKSLHNQYITNTNGNTRADLLPLMHYMKFFYPNFINFPMNDEGKPIFKLDRIAPANNINHRAHRSMGDVIATIELCKLVQQKTPDLWFHAINATKKMDVLKKADELNVFCYGKYDRNREPDFSVYAFVGINNKMNNELLVFNLDYDMNEYLDLDIETMTKLIRKTEGPFKIIKANESPILLPVEFAPLIKKEFKKEKLLQDSYFIKNNFNFRAQAINALEKSAGQFPKGTILEKKIYDGFYGEEDKTLMELFSNGMWDDRVYYINKFKDSRLQELSELIIFHEKPELLKEKNRKKTECHLATRVVSSNKQQWRTIDHAIKELDSEKFKSLASLDEQNQYEDFYQKLSLTYIKILEEK